MANNKFRREQRYYVLKIKDVNKYLSHEQRMLLESIMLVIWVGRQGDHKNSIDCVVVEKDWPEYEPTWQAIEKRMAKEVAEASIAIPITELRKLEDAREKLYDILSYFMKEEDLIHISNVTEQIWRVANTKDWS